MPADHASVDSVRLISAGKFRRYHGESLFRHLLDIPTVYKNARDVFRILMGIVQAYRLLRELRPAVVFVKGGFVGVPVGLAAAALRIPYITHDSDALPGLANRIIARWARWHAVALPKEVYAYPQDKTITVGVPLSHQYAPLSAAAIAKVRLQVGLPARGRVLMITGGGLGAARLNHAVLHCAGELLERYSDLRLVHIAGRGHEAALRQQYKTLLPDAFNKRVMVKGFITNLHLYSAAADIIVTRAGATSIAEFAAQHKACIVVPNPLLTGGHQLKNAQVLAEDNAIRLVTEDKLVQDERALMPAITDLFDNPERIKVLEKRLSAFSQPDAAKRLAMLLLEEADNTADGKASLM